VKLNRRKFDPSEYEIIKEFTPENPEVDSGGIFIPNHILHNPKLNFTQSILLALIYFVEDPDCNGFCYAANSYFSKILDINNNSIKKNLSLLVKDGFLIKTIHNNTRFLKTIDFMDGGEY